MSKIWFVVKYKYPEKPWTEWARTQVPSIVDHYIQGAQAENPKALIGQFSER